MKELLLSTFIFFIISCCTVVAATAQSTLSTTGGDIQGTSGSISYTVGQIAVQSTATITEGVQQPYEIQTVGVDCFPAITLDAAVYPNPTTHRLILEINNVETFHETSLRATLFSANGQHIQTVDVAGVQTIIDMSALSAGTYYLRVTDGQTTLKTFKVVKMM